MEYDNTNRGALFKNDRKELDTHPDYKGNINVNGEEFWLSAWLKTSNDGTKKFMSLSVRPKEEQLQQPPQHDVQKQNGYQNDDLDDTIPF